MAEDEYINELMGQLYMRAYAQFGDAIKGAWFYDKDPCPGCGRPIDAMRYKGKDTLSLNAYIYRKRGILIGYFVSGRCAAKIHRAAHRNPGKQIALHTTIEHNLDNAIIKHMNSMDA